MEFILEPVRVSMDRLVFVYLYQAETSLMLKYFHIVMMHLTSTVLKL